MSSEGPFTVRRDDIGYLIEGAGLRYGSFTENGAARKLDRIWQTPGGGLCVRIFAHRQFCEVTGKAVEGVQKWRRKDAADVIRAVRKSISEVSNG